MKYITNILIFLLVSLNLFAASSFSGDRLREACLAFVESQHQSGVKVDFLTKIYDQKFDVTGVEASFQFKGAKQGHTSIIILFKNSTSIQKTLEVPVKVSVFSKVPVLISNKQQGDIISSKDLAYVEMLINGNEITDPSQLIGKEFKVPVRKGDAIQFNMLKEQKIIDKGDQVKLKVYSGKIMISSMGKAMNEASSGETVRVKRTGGNGIVQGIAYPDGSVVVRN